MSPGWIELGPSFGQNPDVDDFQTVADVNSNGQQATDPDGDGKYEDVDGDGEFTCDDPDVLEQHSDRTAVQNNPEAFDFNEDGDFDYTDVLTLAVNNGCTTPSPKPEDTATETETETETEIETETETPTPTPTETESDDGSEADRLNPRARELSFEIASVEADKPADPWYLGDTAGTHEISDTRATNGDQSLHLSGAEDLGSTRAKLDVDLTNVDRIEADVYLASGNLFAGDVKINIDDNDNTIIRIENKDSGQWHRNLEGDVSDISGEHTLVLWTRGEDNEAYFDNIRFYNADGDSLQLSDVVVGLSDNEPPQAAFSTSAKTVTVGESITFDASESSDSDGSIVSYNWDFESDGSTDASGQSVSHTFEEAGEYEIELRVIDDSSDADTTTQTITVESESDSDGGDGGEGSGSGPFSLQATDSSTKPNSTVTVEFTFTNTNGSALSGPALKITDYPSAWQITDHEDAGSTYSESSGVPTWLWLQISDGDSKTPTMTFEVPNSTEPGEYSVTGEGQTADGTTKTVTATVTVNERQQTKTIGRAIAGQDGKISITEIQQAIRYWATGSEVPDTGGKTIGIVKIQELIKTWASGGSVGSS